MTNEEKAKEICDNMGFHNEPFLRATYREDVEQAIEEGMQWKDEQYKQDRIGFCNFLKEWAQEWLIEQLTAFAQHLNKRGAFRDDLCMDFEHEAQTFIEFQKYNAKQN